MPQTTDLGQITVVTGSYMKGQQKRNRYKNIGALMLTTHSTGEKRYWLRLDADILHASLYALVRAAGMAAGDDSFTCNVFENKTIPAPQEPANPDGWDGDDGRFDRPPAA